jgi:hypothetical protein
MRFISGTAFAILGLVIGAASLEAQRSERETVREREREAAREMRERERDRDGARLDTTVAFAGGGTVEVDLPGSDVTVSGGSGNEIRVTGRSDRGRLDINVSSSRARIGADYTGGSSAGGQFEIVVPVGTRLRLSTQNGDVQVRGVKGELEITTYNGDIDIAETGRTELRTFTGDVRVRSATGEVRVNSMSGDVELDQAAGEVEVHTVSGDVDLRDVRSRFIRVRSTSGRIAFGGPIDGAGRYEFNSHSGGIRLSLPANVGAQLSVSTFSGEIDSRFPLTLIPGDHGIGRPTGKSFTFELGRGNARISAESFSGDIIITSQAAGRDR